MKEILILKEQYKRVGLINSARDLFNKIKKIKIDYNQENFIVFLLDSKNKVIDKKVLFKGGLNMCLLDPKTLFSYALKKDKTNSVILSHNHPSGDLNPSDEDLNIYEILKKAGDMLQLKVLDFIIFNKEFFYSCNNKRIE